MVWSAENRCHRVRDSTFDEGHCCQVRDRSATQNFSILREPTIKVLRAGCRARSPCAANANAPPWPPASASPILSALHA
jgi:hypothetical protein